MLFVLAWACSPINPNEYGNGKYDTASEPSDEVVDTASDTDTDDDTNGSDTDGVDDTNDSADTADTDSPVDPNAIEIFGRYFHQGNEHYFGDSVYSVDYGGGEMYSYAYVQFSNPQRWLVAQNGSENFDEAGYFSRFDWNIDASGSVWICQSTAYAATASEAQNLPAANAFNTTSGCAGGPWIQLGS